jgi:hypothetical protein
MQVDESRRDHHATDIDDGIALQSLARQRNDLPVANRNISNGVQACRWIHYSPPLLHATTTRKIATADEYRRPFTRAPELACRLKVPADAPKISPRGTCVQRLPKAHWVITVRI